MNILFPMAGKGSRFSEAGFTQPKPLIGTLGRPMVEAVLTCYPENANYIFVIRREHAAIGLASILEAAKPQTSIIITDEHTAGPVATALLAADIIDTSEELLVADCDSFLVWPFDWLWSWVRGTGADGGVTLRLCTNAACSYADVDERGWVRETREKDPFTPFSTTGPYWWRRGSEFVRYARSVSATDAVNGEFYVCPLYNSLIAEGGSVISAFVPEFWSLGTPQDHRLFEETFRV